MNKMRDCEVIADKQLMLSISNKTTKHFINNIMVLLFKMTQKTQKTRQTE